MAKILPNNLKSRNLRIQFLLIIIGVLDILNQTHY